MRTISATLPKYAPQEPVEGTVLVAGIYWRSETPTRGRKHGRRVPNRLADRPRAVGVHQLRNAGASGKPSPSNRRTTQYDHFNWGGIANPFCAAEHPAVAAVGTDISGRMYTSQDCSAATTDFSAAKFGDLAYWASERQIPAADAG